VASPGHLWQGTSFLLWVTLQPFNLLIYGVNDIFDQETDALNSRKGFEGARSPPESRRITAVVLTNAPFVVYFPLRSAAGRTCLDRRFIVIIHLYFSCC
jgi:4-hydroxybenzoate polyprenyltransferase